MILIAEPLLFKAPFTFKIHPSRKSPRVRAPRVNSAIKSAKICPLITVLASYLMLYGFNYVTHFVFRLVAFEFSTILFSGCSVSTTI